MLEEIIIPFGADLDYAINELLEAKRCGKSAFCKFFEVTLYSDNISVESAYAEVFGCTREEFYKRKNEWFEKAKQWENTRREWAKTKVPELIERGKAVMYPQRFAEWEKEFDSEDLIIYFGSAIELALELIEARAEGTPTKVLIERYEQEVTDDYSRRLVRELVLKYSKDGAYFFKKTHHGDWSDDEREYYNRMIEENNDLALQEEEGNILSLTQKQTENETN